MDTHTEDDIQVIVQVSETERIAKLQNHDGPSSFRTNTATPRAIGGLVAPRCPFGLYRREGHLRVTTLPHYGKRDGHEVILPSLRRHSATA
jgi:hypothetical protein